MADPDADQDAVRAALETINRAWIEGRPADMRDLLDDRVVMVQPGFNQSLAGRDACLASYQEFVSQATIDRYTPAEPFIQVWGDTAVAWFAWTMAYTIGGRTSRERGHDVFVFRRTPAGWRAVWRTLTAEPLPPDAPPAGPPDRP